MPSHPYKGSWYCGQNVASDQDLHCIKYKKFWPKSVTWTVGTLRLNYIGFTLSYFRWKVGLLQNSCLLREGLLWFPVFLLVKRLLKMMNRPVEDSILKINRKRVKVCGATTLFWRMFLWQWQFIQYNICFPFKLNHSPNGATLKENNLLSFLRGQILSFQSYPHKGDQYLNVGWLCLEKILIPLTLLHSEQPKLQGILAVLCAIGLFSSKTIPRRNQFKEYIFSMKQRKKQKNNNN